MSRSFKSRFYTEKGDFAIHSIRDAADAGRSLLTSILKVTFGHRMREPWIARNAFRSMRPRISEHSRVFEWGSGMSTFWFEKHCAEVYAVEDNPKWHEVVSSRVKWARVSLRTGQDYIDEILKFPDGYFDLISVDGVERCACLRAAIPKLKASGLLVVDNTDKDRINHGDLYRADALLEELKGFRVDRFIGWSPGNFFPQETTICSLRNAAVAPR
jgi:hypothetical protein